MQFKLFLVATLTTATVADDNLSQIIGEFSSCGLLCFSQKAEDRGCQATDFNCVCRNTVTIGMGLGNCVHDSCPGVLASADAGKTLGDLCGRWTEDPPTTEVAAASSTITALVSSASATVTRTPTENFAAGGKKEVSKGLLGALAAAALLV